jgi:hypothetical protein
MLPIPNSHRQPRDMNGVPTVLNTKAEPAELFGNDSFPPDTPAAAHSTVGA